MTITSPSTITASTDGVTTTRIRVVAGALAVSALASAVLLITTPWGDRYDSSADDVLDYDRLGAVRDGAWGGGLADGLAFGVLGITVAIAVCHLVRDRGRVAALVGGALATIGGILFAMGSFAFASTTWFASGISEGAGRELVDYANDEVAHLLGVTMAGYLAVSIASLVLAYALFRARAVWVGGVAAYVVLVFAQFLPVPGRALDFMQVAMMALLIGLAVSVLRRTA